MIKQSLCIESCLILIALLVTGTLSFAGEPSEVAIGTIACRAEWNEFCDDQKTIRVPEGHKLCKHAITVKEQNGDSNYQLVSSDNKSITVKFNAKGNRDRFKQQSASIVLNISLFGVREYDSCPGDNKLPSTTGVATSVQAIPKPEPPVEIKPVATTSTPGTPSSLPAAPGAVVAVDAKIEKLKPHACVCSQWIDADRVTNCLVNGHGRDNASCDSFAASIQCVESRDECREMQKEDCHQVMGLNQTTSQKRIFVADSPYCIKKAQTTVPPSENQPPKK